jgi:hypothetical protein
MMFPKTYTIKSFLSANTLNKAMLNTKIKLNY